MRLDDNLIDDTKCRIFFANAHDLIKAYEALGHRIFESNVRCKLKSSSINDKIAESIRTEKGIREFHLLNNGLTICANSISIRSSKVRFINLTLEDLIEIELAHIVRPLFKR